MQHTTPTTDEHVPVQQLLALLGRLGGLGYRGPDDQYQAMRELGALGMARTFPVLLPMLKHRDINLRCHALEALLIIDPDHALPLVQHLFRSRSKTMRWTICGLMHEYGTTAAIPLLIDRLQSDPDAQIRGDAAYSLGRIGSLLAISALAHAEQTDHEHDMHGHSASSGAETALSDILLKQTIRIVETDASLRWHQPYDQGVGIEATISLGSAGEEYRDLPWYAHGGGMSGFEPPLKPLHEPPFTVDIAYRPGDLHVRRVFIFQRDDKGAVWVGIISRPDGSTRWATLVEPDQS